MRGNIGWCSSLQPDTPVCRSGSHFIALKELCERVPTLRKGLSFVSITKSNLQSSQQRVSEDLIHWLRQAWWTKLRLPVQRQGIINGHSSSPSQWQILHTHRENIVNTHTRTGNVFLVSFAFLTKRIFPLFSKLKLNLNLKLIDDKRTHTTLVQAHRYTLTCRPPSQSHQRKAVVRLHSHHSVSVVWALTCPHLLTPFPGMSW